MNQEPLETTIPVSKRLAIFGATGGIGREIVRLALAAGHHVTALVRDEGRLEVEHPKLSLVVGSVFDEEAVARTICDADAILSALGAPALSRSDVRSLGTDAIIDAMKTAGIDRLVSVSVLGAHESRSVLPAWIRYLVFPLYLRRVVADHERQEDLVRDSGLAWTLVRPPFLTDGAHTGQYEHGFDNDAKGLTMDVSRADVADFMLRQLDSERYVQQPAGISYASVS